MGTRLLRSLLRSGRTQQRSAKKLLQGWLSLTDAATKAATKTTQAATKAATKAKPKARTQAKAKPALTTKPKARPQTKAPRASARTPAPGPASRAPAPTASAPGKWLASYYSVQPGQRMHYWLYLPDHVPDDARRDGMPLVVMLHGCQQSATEFAQGTRMNQHAERRGWAVLYPQQSLSAHAQRCWKWYDRATQEGGGDVAAIVGIINKVAAQYALDRSRIYIAGMSAGAGMADIVALNHPELIAAVGLHSGPVFGAGHGAVGALGVMRHGAAARADHAIEELWQRRSLFPPMPAILIQGQGDKVVRPVNQQQLMRQRLMLNRLPPDLAPRPSSALAGRQRNAHHTLDYFSGRKLMLRALRVEQLEHAWSGGDAALAFHDQAGPDASQAMLDFFARHRRVLR